MRRADRLFQLILLLGRGKILTGDRLAERLGVSKRTVYRDIQDLSLSGVPIEGEAGVGFRLRDGYQIPPLMSRRRRSRPWSSALASCRVAPMRASTRQRKACSLRSTPYYPRA